MYKKCELYKKCEQGFTVSDRNTSEEKSTIHVPSKKTYSFPKSARILKRKEFLFLSSKGHTFYGNWVIIQWRKNSLKKSRLGIIVTKKFGKSHERNRFKRLVREAYRLMRQDFACFADLTIRPRKNSDTLTLDTISQDIKKWQASVVQAIERKNTTIQSPEKEPVDKEILLQKEAPSLHEPSSQETNTSFS